MKTINELLDRVDEIEDKFNKLINEAEALITELTSIIELDIDEDKEYWHYYDLAAHRLENAKNHSRKVFRIAREKIIKGHGE
jgi:hypothetical protein